MSGHGFHVHGPHDHELEHAAQHGEKDSFAGMIAVATAILAMLPPAVVVVLMQRWFVKGLVDTEK